jgi:hypothetical protein
MIAPATIVITTALLKWNWNQPLFFGSCARWSVLAILPPPCYERVSATIFFQ